MPPGYPIKARRPARVYERWPQVRASVELVTGRRGPKDEAEVAKLRFGDAKVMLVLLDVHHWHNESGTPYWQSLGINRRMRRRVYMPDGSFTYTPYDRCMRGHLFTPENTDWNARGRYCRICHLDGQKVRNARARRRAKVMAELRARLA